MEEVDLSRFSKGRVEALSDGIFAIAMTVLVLGIDAPNMPDSATEAQVWSAVADRIPAFFAFMASFITLGMYWVAHHGIFRFLVHTDRIILWMNMYFLMFVSLVPFTTGFYSGDQNSRVANALFGSNLIVLGLLSYAIWHYARKRGHVVDQLSEENRNYITGRILTGPLIAALGLVVSVIQPQYAEFVYFAMIPLFMMSLRTLNLGLLTKRK